jgi:outer membrane protein OmpA-like peptidoglycan-associated protein
MGQTGPRGATLEGPTGPAGHRGGTGSQGESGYTGSQGSTTAGVAGPAGPAGPRGSQGATGDTGAQGRVGVVARWTAYRELWFIDGSADIRDSEQSKLDEIATYMKRNPSLQIGIDVGVTRRDNSSSDWNLGQRRLNSIRDALVSAGVPNQMIANGSFGDEELRRDGRVEVLIASAQ